MKVKELISFLNNRFPLSLQERYDNAGEQLTFAETKINNLLISLDLDNLVIDEAINKKCNFIITHHPFFFKPMKNLKSGDPRSEMLFKLINKKISVYSAHTNLDKIYYDKLADVLGIINKELLIKSLEGGPGSQETGFGVLGELENTIALSDLLRLVKKKLKLDFIVYSGDKRKKIKKIAVTNGAGGSHVEKILREKELDCFLTGDVGYHSSMAALSYDVAIVDAGHFGTERILLDFLNKEIKERLDEKGFAGEIKTYISRGEKNPFQMFY